MVSRHELRFTRAVLHGKISGETRCTAMRNYSATTRSNDRVKSMYDNVATDSKGVADFIGRRPWTLSINVNEERRSHRRTLHR